MGWASRAKLPTGNQAKPEPLVGMRLDTEAIFAKMAEQPNIKLVRVKDRSGRYYVMKKDGTVRRVPAHLIPVLNKLDEHHQQKAAEETCPAPSA